MKLNQAKKKIIAFIQENVGDKPAVLGLSGGIDSSTVAYLAVEALGPGRVHGILSPSTSNTEDDLRLATLVAENLDLSAETIEIDDILSKFQKAADFYTDKKVLGNLKARVRMCLLYGKANQMNAITLGTGNKTELLTGYFTKHGDGAIDILPIADIYKTDLRNLARHIGVPEEIITRKPTAGLWDDQYDEDEIGMSYDELDAILIAMEAHTSLDSFDAKNVARAKELHDISAHKRVMPPICTL